MKRSIGVTVSAILVFLGCGAILLFGGLMAFTLLLAPQRPEQPPFVKYVLGSMVFMNVVFAAWGIASGVGILLLKQWARVSMIVFCCILLFFTVPGMLLVPFLPLPHPPGSPDNLTIVFKIAMSAFYAIFVAVGAAWLYFFNRKSVKDQFIPLTAAEDPFAPKAAGGMKRPLSISIIAGILAVTGVLALPTALLHLPMFFLGFPVTGWGASLFMLTWCVAQCVAGIGLFQLRSWGRILAICVFSFGLLNVASIALIPGSAARFQQVNAEAQAKMQARMGLPTAGMPTALTPESFRSLMWIGAIFGAIFVAVQLWFLVTRKYAFTDAGRGNSLSP